jgi:hypothetical protein
MSVEQIEATLLKLSPEERRRFADWFYQHEDEMLEGVENEIHPEVKAMILSRRDEALAHPERLEPWEGTADRIRAQLNEIRRKKTSSR